MVRNILAVVVGVVVGMAANMAVVYLNIQMYPLPEGLSFTDPEAMKSEGMMQYFQGLPAMAFLVAMVAHLAQSFVGGIMVGLIASTRHMLLAMIVAGLTMIAGIMNLMDIPHPWWMWIEMPLYFVTAWLGCMAGMRMLGK